jgi:hypothetical protein
MDGAKRVAWTLGLVGLWSFLGALAMYGWNPWNMDDAAWQSVCVAVIAGVGAFATNALAPWIKQYGFGAKT